MPTLSDLRSALGERAAGRSDIELLAEYARVNGTTPSQAAMELGFDTGSTGNWGNQLSASVDSYQSGLYGVGEALGLGDWARRGRVSNEIAAGIARERASNQGAIQSMEDIQGPGDILPWVGSLAVQSAPYLGEAALGGLAGRGLATGARVAGSIGRELGMPAAVEAARASAGRAATAGAVAASYPSSVGDILQNQRATGTGETNLLAAGIGGIPYAALNAVGLEGALATGRLSRVGRFGDEMAGLGGGLARTAKNAGVQFGIEGASELGQEIVNQTFGRMAVDPTQSLFSGDAPQRYLESFIGGGALGGVAGGAFGGWKRSDAWYSKAQTEQQRVMEEAALEQARAAKQAYVLAQIHEAQQAKPLDLINQQILPDPIADEARAKRDAEYEAMMSAPSGRYVVDSQTQLERQLTMGEALVLDDFARQTQMGQPPTNLIAPPGFDTTGYAGTFAAQPAAEAAPTAPAVPTTVDKARAVRDAAPAYLKQGGRARIVSRVVGDGELDGVLQRLEAEYAAVADNEMERERADNLAAWYTNLTGNSLRVGAPQGAPNAVQVPSAAPVDVRQRPQDGGTVVQGNAQGVQATGAGQAVQATQPQGVANVGVPAVPGPGAGVGGAAGSPVVGGSVAAPGRVPAAAVGPDQRPSGVATNAPAPAPRGVGTTGVAAPAVAETIKPAVLGGQVDFDLLINSGLDDKMLRAVHYVLGIDPTDGARMEAPLSQQDAARMAGLGENSHAQVSKALKALGITPEVRRRFWRGNADATAVPEGEQAEQPTEVETPEDKTPVLSDERADDTEREAQTINEGVGVVNTPGGSQSDIAAPKATPLHTKSWYAGPLRKAGDDWHEVPMEALANMAVRALDYNTPSNAAALSAILMEVKRRMALGQSGAFNVQFKQAERKVANEKRSQDAKRAEPGGEGAELQPATEDEQVGEVAGADEPAGEARPAAEQAATPTVTVKKRRTIQKPDAPKRVRSLEGWQRTEPVTESEAQAVAETVVDRFQDPPAIVFRPSAVGVLPNGTAGVQGAVHEGKIYIFTEAIGSLVDVARTLFHELLHLGLRKYLSRDEFVAEMRRLADRDTAIRTRAEAWAGSEDGQRAAQFGGPEYAFARGVDENLAELAESKNDAVGFFAKTWRNVVRWAAGIAERWGLRGVAADLRGLTNEEARTYVQSVFARLESGQPSNKLPWASEPAFSNELVLANKLREQVRKSMPPKAQDAMSNVTQWFRKHTPWLMTNVQLAEQFSDRMSKLRDYVKQVQTMTVERTKRAMDVHNVAVDWDAWKKKAGSTQAELLDKVMLNATLWKIHPDKAFDDKEANGHLTEADRAHYDALSKDYARLLPSGKEMYQKVRDSLKKQWDDRRAAYAQLVDYTYSKRLALAMEAGDTELAARLEKDANDAIKEYTRQMKQVETGPYFPLMRFGEYLAIGESKELRALKDQLKAEPGEGRPALRKRIAELERNPAHYEVSAHETLGARNAAMREMKARGLEARPDIADQHLDGLSPVSRQTLDTLSEVFEAALDKNTAAEVNAALAKVFLASLPEMSALRREAARKGIAGASPDMLRAYASSGQQNAFYISRLRHASEIADTMFHMKQQAKEAQDDTLQAIHRELEKRVSLDMQYKETPIQDWIGSLSWTYHLGVSPAFMFINMTQPWLVTGPLLAGKFGLARSTAALSKASVDALKILRDARFKTDDKGGWKWDAWSGISENSLSDREERIAIRNLMERGIVDEGLKHDLAMFAEGSSQWMQKVNRYQGWSTQQIELSNRLTSALAAYRLARSSGMGTEAATDYAYQTTVNSQFDYSTEGTARFMREGGGVPLAKLVFQFRRYQQGMLYLLGSNIVKALGTGPEAKDARKISAYFALASGLAAGALGLPFVGAGLWIANMFMDDDDPRGDAETRLRNLLRDITGDKQMADALAMGIPAFFGASLSQRIGMGDVASPFPMAKFDRVRTGEDSLKELMFQALGPSAGLAARMWEGGLRFGEGDWAKGTEKLLPKAASDIIRGQRYRVEGITEGSGEPTGTELSGWDLTLRSLGIAPISETSYYEGTRAKKDLERNVSARVGRIGKEFKESLREGGDLAEVRTKIAKFNEDHPEARITPKKELEWRKEVRGEGKKRAPGVGIKLGGEKTKAYDQVARFAMP